jgi:hypothetical protein
MKDLQVRVILSNNYGIEKYAKNKAFIPSVGHYDLDKSFDKISRPRGYK